jgi:hypothetical protein
MSRRVREDFVDAGPEGKRGKDSIQRIINAKLNPASATPVDGPMEEV